MIRHCLSNNNKICYSTKIQTFSWTKFFQWHWPITHVPDSVHPIIWPFHTERNMQLQGKESTNSEKKNRAWKRSWKGIGLKVPTTPLSKATKKELQQQQLCSVRLPSFSPRLLWAPAKARRRRRGRTSDGNSSEADQAHPAVPRDRHRQIPVGFSFPSLSFCGFFFLFRWIIIRCWFGSGFRPGRKAGRSGTGICSSTRMASVSFRRTREAR